MLTVTAILAAVPAISAQTNVRMSIQLYPIIGENSPTLLTWEPSPDPFFSDPYYVPPWTLTPMWPDATVTFTRPDGSVDVVNGPFDVYYIQYDSGRLQWDPRFELVYAPDMQGDWTVNFYWPGDATYNAIDTTDTFTVGPHHPKRSSYALMSIRPYPAVGIGQEVLINHFVTPPPMTDRENFRDFKFIIVRPDGSTYYDFTMDAEGPGVCWFNFWPDTIGEWSISFEWDGNHLYEPCSITRTFTVQEDPIPYPVEEAPLPTTEPWDFPVNVFNREWRNIAGPWLAAAYNSSRSSFNPYTEAPKSAHIRWVVPPTSGVGGYVGSYTTSYEDYTTIQTDDQYDASAASIRTIMAGRAYYAAGGTIYCLDLMTGETLWETPGSSMSAFFLGTYLQGATRGGDPVLYYMGGGRFKVYDALTGEVTLDVPAMDMFLYDAPYVISLWPNAFAPKGWICWTTEGNTDNFADRIIWNVTDTYLSYPWMPPFFTWDYYIHAGLLVYQLQRYGVTTYEDAVMEYQRAYNMSTGELVYSERIVDDSDPETWWLQQGPARGTAYGLYFYSITGDPDQEFPPDQTGGYIAFNVSTGELAWKSEPFNTYPWGSFFAYNPEGVGYGMIYVLAYSGVYALNATNGDVVWEYSAGNSGMETPYNTWPFGATGPVVGGGVVFAPNTEHSPTLYYRGTKMHAIDAYTGEGIWSILGWYTPTALAQGTLIASEGPSGYTYAFGKGETVTTVSIQNDVVAKGEPVLIKGSVLDMSPAQEGTAAIADEHMSAWMEYLHMQQTFPMDATGVEVSLDVIDPNGNWVNIGTATSNTDGNYGLSWTPEHEGTYQIIATFEGSESYYASHDTTYMAVGPAPSAAQPIEPEPTTPAPTEPEPTTPEPTTPEPTTPEPTEPEPTTPEPTEPEPTEPTEAPLFTTTTLAIIAAVAVAVVIGIAAYWTLRKRK